MEQEEPYYDEKGTQIKEFAVLKVFHFISALRREKMYMYKWVRLKESNGKLYWEAWHLENNTGSSYWLKAVANKERIIKGTTIVQQFD